jgi:L-threonylcarbamoyladenylate synthase
MQKIPSPVQMAASLLAEDEVVAIPTETVYGLAANLYSPKAVAKIFELKNRPHTNPLIVHVANLQDALPLVQEIPAALLQLAHNFWPGPLTLLLKKSKRVPKTVTAGSDRVAIRVPNHPLTLELLKSINFPVVAPSANPYTRISPTHEKHVRAYFGNKIPYILEGGPCQVGLESTIVGVENERIILYRKGVISKEIIEQLAGSVIDYIPSKSVTPTPGLAPRHYAPDTETMLCEREKIISEYEQGAAVLIFSTVIPDIPIEDQFVLSANGSLEEAAKQLYDLLHEIDHANYKRIICEELPEEGAGYAINDRLRRASCKKNKDTKNLRYVV